MQICTCSGFDSSPLQDKTQTLDGLLDFLGKRLDDCACLELNMYEEFLEYISNLDESVHCADLSGFIVHGMALRTLGHIYVRSLQMLIDADGADKLEILNGKQVTIDELAIVVVNTCDEELVQMALDLNRNDGPVVIVVSNGMIHVPHGDMGVDGSYYTHNQV